MSDADETTPAETPAEATETPEADKPRTAKISLPDNPLSRPTDAAPRPGFRAPPNKGSKAIKSDKKKR
jgi:hypothetical protein